MVAAELEDIGMFGTNVGLIQRVFPPFDPVANLLFPKPPPSSGRRRKGRTIVEAGG